MLTCIYCPIVDLRIKKNAYFMYLESWKLILYIVLSFLKFTYCMYIEVELIYGYQIDVYIKENVKEKNI